MHIISGFKVGSIIIGPCMAFSEDEKQGWLARKRRRERPRPFFYDQRPVGVCIHCQAPFGMADGTVIGGVAVCDDCEECADF